MSILCSAGLHKWKPVARFGRSRNMEIAMCHYVMSGWLAFNVQLYEAAGMDIGDVFATFREWHEVARVCERCHKRVAA